MVENAIVRKISKELINVLKQKHITPLHVILYGSYAIGSNKLYSDMDLIVVSKDFTGKDIFERADMTVGVESELMNTYLIPYDIIYYSDSEWESNRGVIINEAKKNGVVLFSSKDEIKEFGSLNNGFDFYENEKEDLYQNYLEKIK